MSTAVATHAGMQTTVPEEDSRKAARPQRIGLPGVFAALREASGSPEDYTASNLTTFAWRSLSDWDRNSPCGLTKRML